MFVGSQVGPFRMTTLMALAGLGILAVPPHGTGNAQAPPPAAAVKAKIDRAALEREVTEIIKGHGTDIKVGLWVGGSDGAAWFDAGASIPLPTASAIKAFYLVELFDRYKGKLDDELQEARPVLADDRHPALSHFTPAQREDIRRELGGASVQRVGEVMIGKAKVSNAVYNAAANVTTAVLGGPDALTAAIRKREPAFAGVTVRRYMLRDRKTPGDNEATPVALAALHQRLAAAKLTGIDDETMKAVRGVLHRADDPKLGSHFAKGGNLTSDPLTEVRAGWWETGRGAVVCVVMTAQPTPGTQDRTDAATALRRTATRLDDAIVAAGRAATGR